MKRSAAQKVARQIDRGAIDRVIRRHLAALRKDGAMTVRPGYEFKDGQLTGRPAIVVTVLRKRARVPSAQRLPDELDGIPVDVRPSTALQRLRMKNPADHRLLSRYGPEEHREPEWPYERRVSDGRLLSAVRTPAHPAERAVTKKPQIDYTPATLPLRKVSRTMSILACASPDAGFTVLADFLEATKSRLTVGLYDFTSGDILRTVTGLLSKKQLPFKMVLDHPPLDDTANQPDEETVASIRQADRQAAVMWALTDRDPNATKWIYPSAYHIKVAVQDGSAFWLSSGNWNVSNQPNFAAHQPSRGSLETADRDWHVVVTDRGLAKVFEAYIEHDFQVASGDQAAPSVLRQQFHDALEQALAAHRKEQGAPAKASSPSPAVPFTLGKPKLFANVRVTVQPLLTPDRGRHGTMYVDNVVALISSARKRLCIQTQYVHPTSNPADRDFMRLVDAVAGAVRRGVDVRLITSNFENTPQYIEAMHEYGLTGVLRIQDRVHNKGIVVDSKTVMVSSQNWSPEGVQQNRDAGVIIHHAGIAQFFEASFLQDWEDRATIKLEHT